MKFESASFSSVGQRLKAAELKFTVRLSLSLSEGEVSEGSMAGT